ncbi:DUF5134 domain-containing protein [Mycobacterium sp. Y57]|uniref:DUF5134 domain-containing protein n=1 Tax=Mycolicibacterium xanthum TaxID=2796469 RepID=UPI001C8451CB|nr:DUF5134 domain-containing protein [Mycolicibacterium xanthum]MBX7434822.1 DUF5134 domain-containing protein [Mycolicibacterium xanthum]
MFTLADTPVKFVALLALFAWTTLWSGYELARPQDVRQRVSNVLHLAMAVVMLVMVAGPTWQALTAVVPTATLVAGFAAATVWFGSLAIGGFRSSDHRAGLHFSGHATMFGAMTWHLAAMTVKAGSQSGTSHDMAHGGTGHDMSQGDMAGMGHDTVAQSQQPGGVPWIFALVGLPFMAYLLAASVAALHRATRQPSLVSAAAVPRGAGAPVRSCHRERAVGSRDYRLSALSDFAMNFGMFWMSTGLLVPILPFFAAFAF